MATHGLILGKFMPPHAGHISLCRAAEAMVDQLTILVCSMPDDSMPGVQREGWMREMFPNCRVVGFSKDVPQYPHESDDFWSIWSGIVRSFHPEPIDMVFAGEEYGRELADHVGGAFVPLGGRVLDADQSGLGGLSGTAIRHNLADNWRWLPVPTRRDMVKTVVLHGVESVGKSTLAAQLSERLETPWVVEYGRAHCEAHGSELVPRDLELIAAGQQAMIAATREWSGPVLVSDTDWLMTAAWNVMLFDQPLPKVDYPLADLYLYLPPNLPWIDDGTRFFAEDEERLRFDAICRRQLSERDVQCATIDAAPVDRVEQALEAIRQL